MQRTKRLTFLTASYTQVSTVFPFIVVSPAYFAGTIQLGGLMQTASAFNSVQTALSFFVNVLSQLAEWRAVIARLDGFDVAVAQAQRRRGQAAGRGARATRQGRSRSTTSGRAAERQRRWSPPTTSRSRPASACWSPALGRGQVDAVPRHRRHLAVRHGHASGRRAREGDDAAAAAVFPGRHARGRGHLSGRARHVRASAGRGDHRGRLPALAERLDEEAHWNRMLSLGEQQRLGIARAHPACAGLPVPRRGHRLARRAGGGRALPAAQERLPGATIVSIGHRSTLGVPQPAAGSRERRRRPPAREARSAGATSAHHQRGRPPLAAAMTRTPAIRRMPQGR